MSLNNSNDLQHDPESAIYENETKKKLKIFAITRHVKKKKKKQFFQSALIHKLLEEEISFSGTFSRKFETM